MEIEASPTPLDRKVCDANPNFANDTTVYLPRDIRIENNTFQNNSTAAVAAWARWVGLRNNTFTNNFINPQGLGNAAGGGVVFDQCADTINISGNTMTGPGLNPTTGAFPQTLGFELWGRNITVANNNISYSPNEAIGLNAVLNATVTGNTITNNDQVRDTPGEDPSDPAYQAGGITVSTFGTNACGQIPRDSQNVTITGNTSSGQAYGVSFMDRGASRNTVENIVVDPNQNVLSGNAYYPIAIYDPIVGIVGLSPAQDLPVAWATSDTPRALAPDAVSPIQSRCPDSGSGADRETFTFSASDVQGPGAIVSIEVRFVTGGANDTGNPGNTTESCSFIYAYAPNPGPGTPYNILTLETDSGPWPQSTVGPGGSDLTGPYCTIHAGSSASNALTDTKTLNLSLDIDFAPSLGKRYIYMWVANTEGQFSNGSAWKYWGWWLIP